MTVSAMMIDDCFLHDKDRLRHDEALDLLKQRLTSITVAETIPCKNGLGRILFEDVVAPHAVPLHTNAAVDGFAFQYCDLGTKPLRVSNRIAAGDLSPLPLRSGTAARIFTGAPMPTGADTVAMQEDCTVREDTVLLPTELKSGANCRLAGEDLKQGDLVLKSGTRLQAADLAALASIGLFEINVHKTLKVIVFSSGNEMRIPEESQAELSPGEVYDANQPLISALCSYLPVEVTLGGIIPDDEKAVQKALSGASTTHDVIITTGGASRGAEDHMLAVLDHLGKRHLWQLAVKPGRPMMFGQIPKSNSNQDCIFFGLPGNPVAAMVCFLLYTRPALLRLAGAEWTSPHRFNVPAAFSMKSKKPDRREFQRGILQVVDDGEMTVTKFPRDGSGLISSLREADGLIEIPEDVTSVNEGDPVSFIPFSSFM